MQAVTSCIISKNGALWAAYLLVFLMLVFPMVPELFYVKVVLLIIILVSVAIATLKTGQEGIHTSIVLWTLSLSVLGSVFILEGFVAGMAAAGQLVPLYVIWPLIYAAMIAGVRNERILSDLLTTFVVATISIGIYSMAYTLTETGILPESRVSDLIFSDRQAFALQDGWVQMLYPGLNPLLFLVPFSLALLVASPESLRGLRLARIWLWTAVALGLVAAILSGRRALYLVTLTAPLFIFIFASFRLKAERRLTWKSLTRVSLLVVILLTICVASLNAVYGITAAGIAERFSLGFNFNPTSENPETTERRAQFHALLRSWMENPLLGSGYGAPAYGSIRDDVSPYNYELTYLALLHQTGLIGFAGYGAGIIWIYWMGFRIMRAGGPLSALMLACLVGMSSFLIANATNPYFGSFETYWTIFFPLAVINLWLLRVGRSKNAEDFSVRFH